MMVHIIDGSVGGYYVYNQLRAAGIDCHVHAPNDPTSNAQYAPLPSFSMGHTAQEIEAHIRHVLSTYNGIFLISSYVGSLVARGMLDLCGKSQNIIYCDDLRCGSLPVVASSISVNIYKNQRRLARISRRLKHYDLDHEFLVADRAVRYAAGDGYAEADAKSEFNNDAKFLSSASLIVAAHKLGIKNSMYHNYAGLVFEFTKQH